MLPSQLDYIHRKRLYAFTVQTMATSRATRLRSEKFEKNVTKRGNVPVGKAAKREEAAPVSPMLLGFFLFVVVGSAVFQIINQASKGSIF